MERNDSYPLSSDLYVVTAVCTCPPPFSLTDNKQESNLLIGEPRVIRSNGVEWEGRVGPGRNRTTPKLLHREVTEKRTPLLHP